LLRETEQVFKVGQVAPCDPAPSSNDIPYFELWKEQWKNIDFDSIKKTWLKI